VRDLPQIAAKKKDALEWVYLRIGKDKVEASGNLRVVRLSGEPACGDFASSVAEPGNLLR